MAHQNRNCVWLPQTSEEESEEDFVPQTSDSAMACNCPGDCWDRKAAWRISRWMWWVPSWKQSFAEPGASEAVWARAPSWSSKQLGARLAQDHSARAVVCWDLTWRCRTAASCNNRDEMLRDREQPTWLIRVSGLGGRVGERGCIIVHVKIYLSDCFSISWPISQVEQNAWNPKWLLTEIFFSQWALWISSLILLGIIQLSWIVVFLHVSTWPAEPAFHKGISK